MRYLKFQPLDILCSPGKSTPTVSTFVACTQDVFHCSALTLIRIDADLISAQVLVNMPSLLVTATAESALLAGVSNLLAQGITATQENV
jgi:hypothetical protein